MDCQNIDGQFICKVLINDISGFKTKIAESIFNLDNEDNVREPVSKKDNLVIC